METADIYTSCFSLLRGPTSQGETSKGRDPLKTRPIGPRGPREFQEGPGVSGKGLKGKRRDVGVNYSQSLLGTSCPGELKGMASLADLEGPTCLRPRATTSRAYLDGLRKNLVAP